MFRAIIAFGLVAVSQSVFIEHKGPRYPATKGEIWPKPQSETKLFTYFTVNPRHFAINLPRESCPVLERAVQRYSHLLARLGRLVARPRAHRRRWQADPAGVNGTRDWWRGGLRSLDVLLTAPCEDYPHLDMVESYNLTVSDESTIVSNSVWGALRGLESFSQLIYLSDNYSELRVNATSIVDFPRYAHRGLLVDTSRHFISLNNLLLTLDAMAYNKLNVFHWHIVDDQSFPYQSARFPDLSARGAYHERAVYSPRDVTRVVQYARDRGIRVLPEFDVPGHTRSWGEAYPNLLTKCYSPDKELLGLGPMNPARNTTYHFLRELFAEVKELFPERYLHVGGDEVDVDCWRLNPEIQQYMHAHNISSEVQLHSVFMENVLPQLAADIKPIVWQEVVDNGVKLPNDSLVQIWKTSSVFDILRILGSGARVVYSTCWYLDHLSTGGDWREMYACDPRALLPPHEELAARVVGGEACMWSEVVDDNNLVSRVWPRASAAAERLWSAAEAAGGVTEAAERLLYRRLEEHTCRMMRRGVRAQPPSGPGFCLT